MRFLQTLIFCFIASLAFAQPANDDCANAIFIANPEAFCSMTAEYDNTAATTSTTPDYGLPSCWTDAQDDVWFYFQTDATFLDLVVTINGATMNMPQVAVYRGDCSGFAELACAQSNLNESSVELNLLGLDPLEFYWIRVNDYSATATSNEGTFQLCVEEYIPDVNMTDGSTTSCNGSLFDSGGQAGNYTNNENLTYTICPSDPHLCIRFNMSTYDIENNFDNLYIYDGPDITSPLIGALTGVGSNYEVFATSGCMTLNFITDGSVTDVGFESIWECLNIGCPPPPVPNNCVTPVTIPALPFVLTGESTCSVTNDYGGANACGSAFLGGPDYVFEYVSLGSECIAVDITGSNNNTGLFIFDGCPDDPMTSCVSEVEATGGNPSIGFTYLDAPGTYYIVVSTSLFCTPFDINVYTPNCPVPNNLTACTGSFEDSGGAAGNYGSGENYNFTICPSTPHLCLVVDFSTYDIETFGDQLTVYDGPDTNSPSVGSLTGNGTNQFFSASSGCATIEFISDGSVQAAGWQATWTCTQDSCVYPPTTPISVDPNVTAMDIVDLIAGQGTQIQNVLLACDQIAYGTFTGVPGNALGLEEGIILSTGDADDAEGPNLPFVASSPTSTGGDTQLEQVTGITNTNDACALQFEVYAESDFLTFNYVFGSEEYFQYVNSTFNDVFAFLISGPGITGWENLAIIPGTNTPVSINNVNGGDAGTCMGGANQQYYVCDFEQPGLSPTQYNGFTSVLAAARTVTPCNWYTLRLVIADAGDSAFDSGVFIEANSLTTSLGEVEAAFESGVDVDYAIENCVSGFLNFTLANPQTQDVVIYYTLGGTATNGVDYQMIPDSVVFTPGETEYQLPIVPLQDAIIEGPEEIQIYLYYTCDPTNPYDSATVIIQDEPFYDFGLTEDQFTICNGESVQFDAYGVDGYAWTPAISLSDSSIANPIATPNETTTYELIGQGICGYDTTYATVNVYGVNAGLDPIICFGESYDVNLVQVFNDATYSWAPVDGLSCTDCPNPTITPLVSGFVTYTVTMEVGTCITSDDITLQVDPQPEVLTTPDQIICFGDAVNIGDDANPTNYTYSWTPIDGLSCTDCPNPSAFPSETMTYQVTTTTPNCGSATNDITVTVSELEAGDNITICEGDIHQFDIGSSGGPNISFNWSPSQGLACTTCPNPSASPTITTTYVVQMILPNCILSDTVTINVDNVPSISIIEDSLVCSGTVLTLGGEDDPNATYSWSPAETLDDANIANPTASPDSTTSYILTTTVGMCTYMDTVTIEVLSGFDLSIFNADTTINQGDNVSIMTGVLANSDNPIGDLIYTWSPETALDPLGVADPIASPLETITYTVVATNEAGCSAMDDLTIEVINPNFGIPNAFTPNGDDRNDYFKVISNGNVEVQEFKIFDRWGELVFDNQDALGWDGNYKGKKMPNDVYIYVIRVQLPNGDTFDYTGDVTLIR